MGDEFDRIYCKYLAKREKILPFIGEIPFELSIGFFLNDLLDTKCNMTASSIMTGHKKPVNLEGALQHIQSDFGEGLIKTKFPCIDEIYWNLFENGEKAKMHLIHFFLATKWVNIQLVFFLTEQSEIQNPNEFQNLYESLSKYFIRAKELGAQLEAKFFNVPVVPFNDFADRIDRYGTDQFKDMLSERHLHKGVNLYLEVKK